VLLPDRGVSMDVLFQHHVLETKVPEGTIAAIGFACTKAGSVKELEALLRKSLCIKERKGRETRKRKREKGREKEKGEKKRTNEILRGRIR
jgi:hypothetical protein